MMMEKKKGSGKNIHIVGTKSKIATKVRDGQKMPHFATQNSLNSLSKYYFSAKQNVFLDKACRD